jgi:hypothetical protein
MFEKLATGQNPETDFITCSEFQADRSVRNECRSDFA